MSGSVSPLPWTGNKGCIYTTIDAFMPPHRTYVEACMGSAEVFLRKKPVEKEIINDYNGDLVRLFRVLQRNENLERLIGRLFLSFNSEQIFRANKALLAEVPNILDDLTETSVIIENTQWNDFDLAVAFYENQVFSFSSTGKNFAITKKDMTKRFGRLIAACARLRNATIMHRDYKDCISYGAGEDAFILLDPPYKGTEDYYQKSSFGSDEHAKLFGFMNEVHEQFHGSCKFLITYNNDPYNVKFMGTDARKSLHLKEAVDPSIYDEVFNAEIKETDPEEIYRRFNTEGHPLHRGHSLSVSDVVVTDQGAFFCDSIGFNKISFDESKTQKPENLMRVVYVEPGEKPYTAEILHTLQAEQKAVGGLIEPIYNEDDTILVGNEESKLISMAPISSWTSTAARKIRPHPTS